MSVTQNSDYRGVNRITRDDFRALLAANAAPAVLAERDPGEYWDAIQRYNADALFIAAIFMHESQMGKEGTATQTHSWGNTRTPNFGAQSVGTVAGRSGTFPVFANWLDGCISTVARLTDPTWVYAKGDRTIGEVFTLDPSWAPAGDMNDPAGYLRAVLDFMNAHESKTGGAPVATRDPQSDWQPSSNFTSGRNGLHVDHITDHMTAGTSSLAWLRGSAGGSSNRDSSATYLIARDGKIYQMVDEADTPWSDGNLLFNYTGISIEHESLDGTFTEAQIVSSIGLHVRIARRHGWSKLNHPGGVQPAGGPAGDGNVIGHDQVPDPNNPSVGGGGSHHTGCPGSQFPFDRIISEANAQLTGGTTVAEQPEERVDPVTGFKIIGGIRAYIEALEAQIGPEKTLMLIGRPKSNEYKTDYGVAQDFERARLEQHPGERPQDFDILPGLVNDELMAAKAELAKLKAA